MYEPIDHEFVDAIDDKPTTSQQSGQRKNNSDLFNNEDRDTFVDKLLTKYLGEEKQREKNSLRDKIKYKRQQIEFTSKHIRNERKAKALKASKKNKNKLVLSCKIRKTLGLYKIDKSEKIEYEKYETVNKLWKSYACSSLLTCLPDNCLQRPSLTEDSILNEESVLNVFKQLDYHGCHLTVTRSNCKYQIGVSGFVLQDRKNVFYLLTKENEIKIIPKLGNLFELEIFGCKITLVGSNMCFRPEIRTTKHAKIKTKTSIK